MKKLLSLLFVIGLACLHLCAQDIIVKRDGSIIKAKVLELTETSVLYKNHANLDGPTYSLNIGNILSLTYENGEMETFDNSSTSPSVSSNLESKASSSEMSDAILLSRIADLNSKADHIKAVGKWLCYLGMAGIIVADVLIFGDNYGLAIGVGVPVMLLYMWGEMSLFNSFENSYRSQAKDLRYQLKNKGTLSFTPTIMHNNLDGGLGGGIALSLRF